jgi:hypothetical protein
VGNPWIDWSTRLGEVERRQYVVLLGIGTMAVPLVARHALLPLLHFSNTTILQDTGTYIYSNFYYIHAPIFTRGIIPS